MNNKGQSLVTFVIILPILLMILALVIDVGFLYSDKNNVDNNVKDAIEYGLSNLDKESGTLREHLTKILSENIENISKLNIDINNNEIGIDLSTSKDSIFANIYSKAKYDITSSYVGIITEDNISIERKS